MNSQFKIFLPLLLLLLATNAFSEEYHPLSLEELRQNPKKYQQQKISFWGKYKSLLGTEENYQMAIYYCSLILIFDIKWEEKLTQLQERSYIEFRGVLTSPKTFYVHSFTPLKEKIKLLDKQFKNALANQNLPKLKKISLNMLSIYHITGYEPLQDKIKNSFTLYLQLQEKQAPPQSFEEKFKNAQAWLTLAKNRKAALKRLVKLLRDYPQYTTNIKNLLTAPYPQGVQAISIKEKNKTIWLLQEEFHQKQGTLKLKDGTIASFDWVVFRDFVKIYILAEDPEYFRFENFFQISTHPLNYNQAKIKIQKGEASEGMKKDQIIYAWGYPKQTYFYFQKDEFQASQNKQAEVWIYLRTEPEYKLIGKKIKKIRSTEKYYLFFYNGILIGKLNKKQVMEMKK